MDPATLEAVGGTASLELGIHYVDALSPDGELLAVMRYPRDDGPGGQLDLIDVEAWTARSVDVPVEHRIAAMAFAPDSAALYWTMPTSMATRHSMGSDYVLVRHRLDVGSTEELVAFEASFAPWEMRTLPSGRVALFGVPTDKNLIAIGPPRVVIVDPETATVSGEVILEGVAAGQTEQDGEVVEYEMHYPGLAWDLPRELLYVVHPDEDKVTSVDLAAARVSAQSDIHAAASPLEHLARWLVPVARAKFAPGTERQAAVSPDGERLYFVAVRHELTCESAAVDSCQARERALGGSLIRTDDLREKAAITLPVSHLALSPDGETLLLTGAERESGASAASTGSGLYVLNARTLDQLAHLEPGAEFSLEGFSASSRYAYLSQWVPSGGQASLELRVLDIESQAFTAIRELGEHGEILLEQ